MAAVEAHRHADTRKRRHLRRRPFAGGFAGIEERWRAAREKFTWWEITIFIVGVLAAFTVVGALFFAVGNTPSRVYTDAPVPAVDTPEFAVALSNLVRAPIDRGGTVTVLNNGDEFVPALIDAINNARHTINFSVYIWKAGELSDKVLMALLRKQQQGVQVRILLDGVGAARIRDKAFEPLMAAGAKVEKYRTAKFGQLTRYHRRNHRRAIVIDGDTGFTGGMAVSDVWLGHAQDADHWRDIMFKITGPLARRLQSAFVDTWVSSSGEILVGPDIYPISSAGASGGTEEFISLPNSPADDEQSMAYFFLLPIMAARHSVYLGSPYFIPDVHMKRVLEAQARAGVDVRLLLPGPHIDDWMARASSQARYDELLQAGVKIAEYQPTFIHAKYAVIDGKWCIIGSPNLNSRSRQLDEEVAFGILDPSLAGQIQDIFFRELQKAKPIDLNEWRKRNPMNRMFETFSRVFDQQS